MNVEKDWCSEQWDIPMDVWLYGVQQPLRIGSNDAPDSLPSFSMSSSSSSEAPLSAKLEMAQERHGLRKLGLASLLRSVCISGDLKPLQKTTAFRATLDAGMLNLELNRGMPEWTIDWSDSWGAVLQAQMDGRRCEDYIVVNSHDEIIDPFKFPPDKSSFPLRFTQKEMGKFTALSVSLISTDLMWAKFASPLDETSSFQIPSYILAIAPRTSLSSQLASLGKTWLLCVGQCSDRIFHQMMFEFGRAGALRWDFEDNFQLETPTELGLGLGHSTPRLARTIGSVRFPGQPEVVSIQFAEKSESLHRQLTIMARIQMHPNIIGFHGAFYHQDGDQLMLTFQHVPRDLALQIQLLGALEQSRCLEVMYGILTALNYLHQNSVVHRNIHPRAVCLSRTGKVMLTGFDDAVNIDDHNAMKTVAGTPGYVAPELILRKPYGLKVDIFSVGAIYFTVLTGQQPFWRAGDDDHAVLQRTVEARAAPRPCAARPQR